MVEAVDTAASQAPAYYMINCAHPNHFRDVLPDGAPWLKRIRGLRANARGLEDGIALGFGDETDGVSFLGLGEGRGREGDEQREGEQLGAHGFQVVRLSGGRSFDARRG